MLPTITYQQHAIIGMKAIHKLVHLLGGRERGFIERIQAALSGVRLLPACKMLLQRCRGCCPYRHRPAFAPRGTWAQSLPLVSLRLRAFTDDGQRRDIPRTGDAIQTHQLFAGDKRFFLNCLVLRGIQFRVAVLHRNPYLGRDKHRVIDSTPIPLLHPCNDLAFHADHRGGRVLLSRSGMIDRAELSARGPLRELLPGRGYTLFHPCRD